ncbi:predicted protein [Streptomyces sp. AA4]|nr:predicted protein [Streptomyces sp. AA4]
MVQTAWEPQAVLGAGDRTARGFCALLLGDGNHFHRIGTPRSKVRTIATKERSAFASSAGAVSAPYRKSAIGAHENLCVPGFVSVTVELCAEALSMKSERDFEGRMFAWRA